MISLGKIVILAAVQGAAELLPVSSSAHVIVAEKLLGLDPTAPEMTLLLVMLHTGTMLAVICYFWPCWKRDWFASRPVFWDFTKQLVAATACTGAVGPALKILIEKVVLRHLPHAEVEMLFGNLKLITVALAAAGLLIIYAGRRPNHLRKNASLGLKESSWIGAVQGVCLPFRGFSRSGATISTGLVLGVAKDRLESFSFALAVVLTPPVVLKEVLRLWNSPPLASWPPGHGGVALFYPSLLGMVFSFAAGLLALKWLSRWLEQGRWHLFGYYCLVFAGLVALLVVIGF